MKGAKTFVVSGRCVFSFPLGSTIQRQPQASLMPLLKRLSVPGLPFETRMFDVRALRQAHKRAWHALFVC